MIRCIRCKVDKSETEFSPSNIKSYIYICRECNRKYQREYAKTRRTQDNYKTYMKEYLREYQRTDKFKEYRNNRYSERITEDIRFKINLRFGTHLCHALKGRKAGRRWIDLVKYNTEDLMSHLESQFAEGMSWSNYGEWHVDHIVPKSKFKYASYEDDAFKQCWSLDNLQPLWAKENLAKGNRTVA
jgi:5-methylcytosine-specific restriction endonuclease McrA